MKCSEHNRVLVRRVSPFPHYACPVPGCTFTKPDKWGRKIFKRKRKTQNG